MHRQVNMKEWPAPSESWFPVQRGPDLIAEWCFAVDVKESHLSLSLSGSLLLAPSLLQMIASSACFFFFYFLVTQCCSNSRLRLCFFCSHFYVSFRKKNIVGSRLSRKERRCGMHGVSCKYRPRPCPAVLVISCSRGCAVGSHPVASQLCHKLAWQQSEFLSHSQHSSS